MAFSPSKPIRLFALVAIMLIATETTARAVDARVGVAYDWGNPVIGQRFDHLRARTTSGSSDGPSGAIDVVFVGSSVVAAAIDPPIVLAEIEGAPTGYNAALGGSPMLTVSQWASDVVIPATCPLALVVGISVRDWNDNNPSATSSHESFVTGIGFRSTTGADLGAASSVEKLFGDNLALVRLRPLVRAPKDLLNAIRWSGYRPLTAAGRDTAYPGTIGPYEPPTGQPSGADPPPAHFIDFATGGRQQAAVTALLETAEASGIATVVIDMPVLERDLADQLPGSDADLVAYERSVAAMIEQTGAIYLDLSGAVADRSAFSDEYHTNARGVTIVSELIGERLAELDLPLGRIGPGADRSVPLGPQTRSC